MCDLLDGHETVASATECTGLKPAPPLDENEDGNESALYAVHSEELPKKHSKKKNGKRSSALRTNVEPVKDAEHER